MNQKQSPAEIQAAINVTPLVDVVLVLLIIFMVITPLAQTVTDVFIPKISSDPAPTSSTSQLVVKQNSSGNLFLNSLPVSRESLSVQLQGVFEGQTGNIVFYSGSDDLRFGTVVSTLDAIHRAGADSIGIVTVGSEDW